MDLGLDHPTEQGAVAEGPASKAAGLLETLYQTRFLHLVYHLRKLSRGRDSIQGVDLEDLVSQAFLQSYATLPSNPAQAYTYLRTTATRLFLDQTRRSQVLSFCRDFPELEAPDPIQVIHLEDLLSQALAPLLDKEREILLEWARGTDLRELARSRGITIKAAKSLMFRARAKARRALQLQ